MPDGNSLPYVAPPHSDLELLRPHLNHEIVIHPGEDGLIHIACMIDDEEIALLQEPHHA